MKVSPVSHRKSSINHGLFLVMEKVFTRVICRSMLNDFFVAATAIHKRMKTFVEEKNEIGELLSLNSIPK